MDTNSNPFPDSGFRYSLVPDGIVLEVSAELRAFIQAGATSAPVAGSRKFPLAYGGQPFLADVAQPWGFGGNLRPYDAPPDRSAWLAVWPTKGGVEERLQASQILAASVAVLARFVRQYVQRSGYVGDKAPLFLPDPMMPADRMSGAAINAEFHHSVETWITPAPMRALEGVSATMCRVYATLHPSPFASGRDQRDYYVGVGRSHDFRLQLAIGNAAGMATDHDRMRMAGYPIPVTSYNVEYAAQQLTVLAALIQIAGMAEAELASGEVTETA